MPKLIHPHSIRSIVIRCPNWIGDAVMATPIFGQMRTLFPHAKVTALAHEPIAQLLEGIEGIDEFLVFSRRDGKKLTEQKRVARTLKERNIDLGILLTRSFSSAWMLWRGRVRWRVGFSDHFRRLLLNIPVSLPKEELHDVMLYEKLLHPFGAVEKQMELSLVIRQEEQEKMRLLLSSLGKKPEEKLIVINPGAAYGSAKCWPKESFRSVAQELQRTGFFCVFVGDEKSVPMINEIIQNENASENNLISLAGKTSLRELMAILSLADCVLSNDSGPMHIAAALKRPLVAIFGSTNPARTGPWGCGKVLYKHVACSPCYLRTCPIDFRCMHRITPEEVLSSIQEVMR